MLPLPAKSVLIKPMSQSPASSSFKERVMQFLRLCGGAYFQNQSNWVTPWLERIGLAGVYILGLYLWGDSLNWGQIQPNRMDWSDITWPRLHLLQDAVTRWIFPLHTAQNAGLKGVTDRFLAIPDSILSPQILLLRFVDIGVFVLLNTLLLYSIGALGLFKLKKEARLSLGVFIPLFLLFNFNGHITAHIAIGHANWAGYFLLPYFVLLIFRLLTSQPAGWRWVSQAAILLFVIFLQGAFHQFVWCILFLACLPLFQKNTLRPVLLALAAALLLSAPRILPTALVSGQLRVEFMTGFTTTSHLLSGLVTITPPADQPFGASTYDPLVWEFDHYIGWVGLLGLLFFGTAAWVKNQKELPPLQAVFGPVLVLAVLSMGQIYRTVFQLGIPLFSGERMTSRFMILPIVFLSALAAVALQKRLEKQPGFWGNLLLGCATLVLFSDLEAHRQVWNVRQIAAVFIPENDPLALTVLNRPDPLYLGAVLAGTVIMLVTWIFLAVKARREDRHHDK